MTGGDAGPPGSAAELRRPIDELPDPLRVPTVGSVRAASGAGAAGRAFRVTVTPPGSKSLTNRALVLAALTGGASRLRRALTAADDARRMIDALRALGVGVDETPAGDGGERDLVVRGERGSFPRTAPARLFLNNAGTATRFLTAAAALARAPVTIDGNARMRERPIGELVGLLSQLGVEIEHTGRAGFVPIRVIAGGLGLAGGRVVAGATASSQYISALLLAAPWTERGVEVVYDGPATSPSYVRMTCGLLARLGARVALEEDPAGGGLRRVGVAPGGVGPFDLAVEPDASGATYWWAAAAITPGATVTVAGLPERSLQGDAAFASELARLGAVISRSGSLCTITGPAALGPADADLSDMPDAAMTLAVVACFASGVSTIRGLKTLRVKETDRIEALRVELGKIGARVEPFDEAGGGEGVRITPPRGADLLDPDAPPVEFDTYDDHRMAMALALVGLRRSNVWIRDPGCVRKTYPGFFAHLAGLYDGAPS